MDSTTVFVICMAVFFAAFVGVILVLATGKDEPDLVIEYRKPKKNTGKSDSTAPKPASVRQAPVSNPASKAASVHQASELCKGARLRGQGRGQGG